jgi:cobalt-zinc-cadmium efflux system outer membrane protein
MKTLACLIIISIAAVGLAQTPADEPHVHDGDTNALQITPEFISLLVKEMETNNPAFLATLARTNAAAASVRSVRTWEDPTARLGGMGAREELRASDGDVIYGVEQKLPLFGKPQAARRLAAAGLGTEIASSDYQFQMLRRELAKATFRTALADKIVQLGAQDIDWLEAVARTVQTKYGAGQATLVETLQVANERARRANQLRTDRNNLDHERVALNRLLNRELHSPWPVLLLPPAAEPVIYSDRLVQLALRNEPKIKLLQQQIKQGEASVDLTRRQRFPDVSVGLEGRNYTGDASFRQGMVVFSMNLPWVNRDKYRSDIQRDEAKLKATELDLADYQLAVREDVHHLTIKIDAARRDALLYRDEIIPRSHSALESARSAWEANRSAFRDVLDARRMWLEGETMYARAIAEQYDMLSELVLCCGLGKIESLNMIDVLPNQINTNKP